MKIKLDSFQKQMIENIAKKNGVVFAVIFGSASQGKERPESDFDIAVLLKKEPDYKTFSRLFSAFSDVFKGKNVDLRFLNEADPFFRFEVVKNGVLIYGSQQDYNEFKIYSNKIYIDDGKKYFPYLEQLLQKKQRQLEEAVL
jgi:predicted nucleotidyltransferase